MDDLVRHLLDGIRRDRSGRLLDRRCGQGDALPIQGGRGTDGRFQSIEVEGSR